MFYSAWDREINISLFFCDVFVWKWGPRPRTSSRCYHGNKSAATFKKGVFVHPHWVHNCMQNFYRDLFLSRFSFAIAAEKQLKQRKHCKKHFLLVVGLERWCSEKGIAKEIENYEPTQLNTLLERLKTNMVKPRKRRLIIIIIILKIYSAQIP